MSLRILNVNDMLDLETGGGTAERTFQMSRSLARQGVECEVLTIDTAALDVRRIAAASPARVTVLPALWPRFKLPRGGWSIVRRAVAAADIVHLMGHWSMLNAMVYVAARRAGKPYVVCPAGALPIFGRSKWLKRLYNLIIGNAIIRNASGWIAVTASEFPQFESYDIDASRVKVIPNGVSIEDFPATDIVEFRHRHGLADAPVILFMGRLNPIKGPDLLLQAFSNARHAFPQYHLVFAGPDGGMLDQLRGMAEQAGLGKIVHFLGHVSGADKSAAYRMADLLVVPSRQEAMSIVAIEAGICGVPVLMTDQCGLGEIRSVDARLEVPPSAAGLAEGLTSLLTDHGSLKQLASAWSDLVESRFAWTSLVPAYTGLYRDILARLAHR
ncbi:MAG TPA: glycosyltransferase [Sideroxyarcus sp.]|nr:glycosyltransferase [Sideroxyarcus sp.]